MEPMNLRILHGVVGPHSLGDVIPLAALDGGYPEADRLAAMGAVKWTTEAPTRPLPASADAVMEMGDDELAAENAKLRERLAVLTAQRDALLAELEGAKKATPPAPVKRGRAKKAEDAPAEPVVETAVVTDNPEQPSLPITEPEAAPAEVTAPTE